MRSPGWLAACALGILSLMLLTPVTAIARHGHPRHSAHQRQAKSTNSKRSTLSPSAPSGVRRQSRTDHRTLPYTGFNLWAYALIGLGMVAAGLLLRRLIALRR